MPGLRGYSSTRTLGVPPPFDAFVFQRKKGSQGKRSRQLKIGVTGCIDRGESAKIVLNVLVYTTPADAGARLNNPHFTPYATLLDTMKMVELTMMHIS